MSKVDDELTRRLRRAERPVDGDGLFEGLARRRSHRERVRRVQIGLLAMAVIAATAGGFVALRHAFEGGARIGGEPTPQLPANGEIVFIKDGEDVRLHIYAAQPDGSSERQITSGATQDAHPAVSPDGRTIAFVHALDGDGGAVVATVPIAGGAITWLTEEYHDVTDPDWSPDGMQIAFVGYTRDAAHLYVVDVITHEVRRIPLPFSDEDATQAHPTWSPDGTRITFALGGDLVILRADGSEPTRLIETKEMAEFAPAWSPDGTRIAFLRAPGGLEEVEAGVGPNEVWTIAPDGGAKTLIATAVEAPLSLDIAWAPDATALLVSNGDWIYRVDPSPKGEPRNNLTQIVRGVSPAWQPLPGGESPSPIPDHGVSPAPSESPSPEPDGHDIGLPFRLCHLHPLTGIDLLGDGAVGTAWTGSRLKLDGTCPSPVEGDPSLLAVDVDGDRQADAFSVFGYCQFCRPFAAVDFDADGDEELALMVDGGSIQSFRVYSAVVAGGEPQIAPILVASPGHPSANHEAGQPLTFSSGGDEGYGAWVRCEGFPGAPVLITTWRDAPIDGTTMEVHETRLVLQADRMFHVVGTTDYEAPVSGEPIPNVSEAPGCDVDWQLWV